MLQQGSIVWVSVSDPNGRNAKCRPAVVVTPTEEIEDSDSLILVAATGTFKTPLPDNHVRLPWQRGGHPRTGLYKPCVAVCDWLIEVSATAIDSIGGVCPNRIIDEILMRIPPPQSAPDAP